MRDHPRLRGEHQVEIFRQIQVLGSPPPTRGTLEDGYAVIISTGITPAYAGNTSTEEYIVTEDRDHPRLRGEHEFEDKVDG